MAVGALVLAACIAVVQPDNATIAPTETATGLNIGPKNAESSEPAEATNPESTSAAVPNELAKIDPPNNPEINRRVKVPDNLRVNWLIPPDGIRPIYEPEFAPAQEVPLHDDELIIGVAWDGEAKAYPISVLRSREMVNDELAGIPTLVTW